MKGLGWGGGAHPCKSSRRSVVFIYLFQQDLNVQLLCLMNIALTW